MFAIIKSQHSSLNETPVDSTTSSSQAVAAEDDKKSELRQEKTGRIISPSLTLITKLENGMQINNVHYNGANFNASLYLFIHMIEL